MCLSHNIIFWRERRVGQPIVAARFIAPAIALRNNGINHLRTTRRSRAIYRAWGRGLCDLVTLPALQPSMIGARSKGAPVVPHPRRDKSRGYV